MKKEYQQWFNGHDLRIQELKDHTEELYKMLDDDPPPPPPLDRKDVPWWPNRMTTAGVTAFPLSIRDKEYIDELIPWIKEHGYNTLSVGAQSWTYAQAERVPMLPGGPHAGAEWAKNLDRMLDATARHEGIWLQLIPTFGLKQHDEGGQEYQWHLNHAKRILEIIKAGGYLHLLIDVMNEFKHPLTNKNLGDTDIMHLAQFWQENGFKVTSDHGGHEPEGDRIWNAYWPKAWIGMNFKAWHPSRNPHPTSRDFKRAVERWESQVLLYNETLCYGTAAETREYKLEGKKTMSNLGRGSDEDRKWPIRHLKANIRSAGDRSRFFFHSIWLGIRGGLDTARGWMPKY